MTTNISNMVAKPVRYIFRKNDAEIVYDKLVAPYFRQPDAQKSLKYIGLLNGAVLGGGVYFNYIWRDLLNNLAARDVKAVSINLLGIVVFHVAVSSANVVQSLITQKLKLGWNFFGREKGVEGWLSPRERQRLVTSDAHLEPEQRIATDIDIFIEQSQKLTDGFTSTATNVLAYSIVLMSISPKLCAITFGLSAVGTWGVKRVGRGLAGLDTETATAQNAYRNAVIEVRSHGQSIALWGGEAAAQQALTTRSEDLNAIGQRMMTTKIRLETVRAIYETIAVLCPYAVTLPAFFRPHSVMGVGDVPLSSGASHNLRNSLDVYSRYQESIAAWRACAKRLTAFYKGCEGHINSASNMPSFTPFGDLGLSVENVVLQKSRTKGSNKESPILCANVSFELKAGDRLAIVGSPGFRESNLFRVLAGITPHEGGEIRFTGLAKNSGDVIFVSHDQYLPHVPLAQLLSFPSGRNFSIESMEDALDKAGLNHLAENLENEESKGREIGLNEGEVQRLNVARLLLHSPRILGLPEQFTAALSPEESVELHEVLFRELSDSIIISIVTRPDLIGLHTVIGKATPESLIIENQLPDRDGPRAQHPLKSLSA